VKGLLSALWSFMQHPAAVVEDHVTALEERLSALEGRVIGDLQAALRPRLEAVRNRVVEDLKRELRRVALVLALAMACAVLGLLGATFAVMAVWMGLAGLVGAIGASLVLTVLFLVASLIVFRMLHSVLHQ
jgi:fatty acid desaturase